MQGGHNEPANVSRMHPALSFAMVAPGDLRLALSGVGGPGDRVQRFQPEQ